MGSGFVLSVPVFFDKVFYLLVPLARSMHRRTGKQYLKYILAIAAGGAITHTLVPPTPGPLMIASNLGVDLGMMILVGTIGAGSLVGSWMNDSGFWIFAKMGGLTEVETLKSWTIMLIVLGITSFTVTLILSQAMPLV